MGDQATCDWRTVRGSADGFAPGICSVGVDVFVLGEGQDLHEGLAEIGEGGGGFGFDLTLGDSGERRPRAELRSQADT